MIPSKIKSIYIELPNYQFNHSSSTGNYEAYISRDRSFERLKMLLLNSDQCESGTYLVAGYRGMGKTSLVDHVIRKLNEDSFRFWDIHISLSQDDLKDFDALKLIAGQLALEWDHTVHRIKKIGPVAQPGEINYISGRINRLSNSLNSISKIQKGSRRHDQIDQRRKKDNSIRQLETDFDQAQEWTRSELLSKEVERELIYILDLISTLRESDKQIPQLVFILDELDKIEPTHLRPKGPNTSPIPAQEELDNVYGANRVRRRQEVISKLLANLKSFLNRAKAKFIFIGGREMYDASLADISDRDSFYSSIFHSIIYVNSFFKDKFSVARSGVTRLTEAFLCKIITPKTYVGKYFQIDPKEITDDRYSLKVYFHYLIDLHFDEQHFKNATIGRIKNKDEVKAIYKLIFFLQNFVLFLAYRSNGTPKKIVSILESYIQKVSQHKLESANYLTVPFSPNTNEKVLCLKFGYRDQYEIGLTSNIYRPYMITHSRYLKSLGDKLLYSSAYIIDYLLKFHSNAFSWRNLELLPEIILNKDPNFRYFITNILNFLSGMYIRETTTGMFQYKFYNKAAHEIKLLTKISETASAAFNFTLDESLHIIQYYRRKLVQLRKTHPNYTHEYVHSIGFIEGILGDLYFLDKEYDEAIVYYTNSIQVLRRMAQQEPEKMTKHQIVLYVKNKLHLGLCLEKIKAFDSAYTVYRGLILNTPRLLEKAMEGFTEEDIYGDSNKKGVVDDEWDKPIRRMQLLLKPHIALLDLIEKQRMDGITYANLSRNHREVYSFLVDVKSAKPETSIEIGKGIFQTPSRLKMDSMRVAVLLSDYYCNVGSLLFFKNRNFPELHKALYDLNLLGESNQDIFKFIDQMRGDFEHYNPSLSSLSYYYLGLNELVDSYHVPLQAISKLEKAGTQSYDRTDNALVKALYLLFPESQGVVSNTLLFTFGNIISRIGDALLACLSDEVLQKQSLDQEVLSVFGDAKYDETQSGTYNKITNKILGLLQAFSIGPCQLSNWCNINHVLLLYRIAGLFYFKAGRTYSYAFQYKKLLFILRDYLQYYKKGQNAKTQEDDQERATFLKHVCENVAERIISANTWINDVSNRPQVLKYREMFRFPNKGFDLEETRLIYLNLSTNPEIRETIALTEEIKLKLLNQFKIAPKKEPAPLISPFDLVSSRYSRVFELRHQAEINFYLLKKIGHHKLLKSRVLWNLRLLNLKGKEGDSWGNYPALGEALHVHFSAHSYDFEKLMKEFLYSSTPKINRIELKTAFDQGYAKVIGGMNSPQIQFPELFLNAQVCNEILNEKVRLLIRDSIFALFEVVRSLNIYGISYISSHSFLANIHYKLADWCSIAANYDIVRAIARCNWPNEVSDHEPELRIELKRTLGEEDVHYLDPNYNNELAIQHFYAALQTHNGGNAYKKVNQSMSFLEDDFNDNLSHFSAAAERFRINLGDVHKKLAKLQAKLEFSKVNDYDCYLEDGGLDW